MRTQESGLGYLILLLLFAGLLIYFVFFTDN